jgi:hypothetical protein
MQEAHQTYTYTARNASDPTRVVTFTLYNNHLRVNLTGVLEQADQVAGAEDKPAEIGRQFSTQAKPAAMKMVENFSGPAHISDVDAHLDEEKLKVTLWQRIAGLRLAPVQFNMGKVDNADAAEAFVDELDQRKDTSTPASRFVGPLDYWAGWAGLLLLLGIVFRWSSRNNEA